MPASAQPSLLSRYALERLGPKDLEVLRLVLRGESVIDWRRLRFETAEEVDRFLRVNLFEPDDPADVRRLFDILDQSVSYLRKTFRYRVAEPVARPARIQDLFLAASGVGEHPRLRRIACVVLKVMHTVHHVDARELLFRARISEVELSLMVEGRVTEAVEALVAEGLPVVHYEGSSKTRESVITKLISKRENLGAEVYDRHRYRIVVESERSLPSVVLALADTLFPFNYVVPGQSQNSLVSLRALAREHPALAPAPRQQGALDALDLPRHPRNEFSGRSYRILNFIVYLPLRIDATALSSKRKRDEDLGRIVFVPVELQVVDAATLARNEEGENSHQRYKKRQLLRVLGRLSRGLVVPRRQGRSAGDGEDEADDA